MNKIIYNLLKKYSKKFRKAYDPKRAEINRDSLLQIIFEPLRDYLYRIGVTFFGIPKFLNWFVTHGQLEELKQDLDGDIITVYDFESVEKISPDVFYSNEEFSKVDAEVQGISDIDNQRLKILYVAALKMANEYGLKVRNKFMPPGLFGYAHQNRTNVVNILKTDFPAVAFETLIHEITHAILHQNYHPKHPDFENSKIKNLFWFYVFENNEEEMMADYVAALVLNAFGIQRSIDSLVSNSEKVKNWIEKNDKNLEYSKELAEILIKRLKIIRKNLMEENVT